MFDEFLGLLIWMTSCFCLPLVSCNGCWSWEVRTNNIHKGFVEMGCLNGLCAWKPLMAEVFPWFCHLQINEYDKERNNIKI